MNRVKALAAVVAALVERANSVYGDGLVGILQFGSTVSQIKPVTDLDLLVIVRDLDPDPSGREKVWLLVESQLDELLRLAREAGLQLMLSPIIKTPAEAQRFHSYYLDFPDQSVVLFDSDQFLEQLIERTRTYIRESGAVKKRVGSLWYWDLAPDATFMDVRKVGW